MGEQDDLEFGLSDYNISDCEIEDDYSTVHWRELSSLLAKLQFHQRRLEATIQKIDRANAETLLASLRARVRAHLAE